MRPSSLMASTSRCWASSSPRASDGEQTKDWFWDDFETVHLSDQLADLTGPKHMIAKPLLQTVKAVASDQEPDLQGPEAPARRNGPLGITCDRSACRLQVLRLDLERVELGRVVPEKLDRAIELCPQPLVGIDDNAVAAFHARPEILAKLLADHCCASPCRIEMGVEALFQRHVENGSKIVGCADARATCDGDYGSRHMARRPVLAEPAAPSTRMVVRSASTSSP